MTTLADDLLRSRTIPELRELVNSLEKDSGAKRTELQHMVGSKYHDFIQSADKIASMKEKSVAIEQQINSFWSANDRLLTQARTIINFSQPEQKRLKPTLSWMPLADVNCATVWTQLNDCNVFEATKAVMLANLLAKLPAASDHTPTSDVLSQHYDAASKQRVWSFGEGLSADVRRQLSAVGFLRDTVADDIHMLLLCEGDADDAPHGQGSANTEVVRRARALAALSVAQAAPAADGPGGAHGQPEGSGGLRGLLQTYLEAAAVRVQDILDSQLVVDQQDGDHERSLRLGIVSVVKLLQRIVVDVHVLFLSAIDPAAMLSKEEGELLLPHSAGEGSGGHSGPLLGMVNLFQKVLLHDVTQQLQQYVGGSAGAGTANALHFDHQRALHQLTAGTNGALHAVGAGHTALLREQRKAFKSWLEDTLGAVTARCKAVLSGLTSAAEVAHLQQQVWAACINIPAESATTSTASAATTGVRTKEAHAGNAVSSLESVLAAHFTYNQRNWETASANVLAVSSAQQLAAAGTGDGGAAASAGGTAHTYLWCNVFRACFLHQVERLLKRSCDEVLAHTKLHVLRLLRQQGVQVDAATLRITPTTTSAASADQKSTTAGKKRALDLADYSADAAQRSSPQIFQLAERIRLQFEQDLGRLLADVLDPVASTESGSPSANAEATVAHSFSSGNLSGGAGDSADPQSAGALARAMRTQCAQLVGHTLVLLRNLVQACQDALRERGSLPGAGSGDLYECLRGGDQPGAECILTPDVQEVIRRYGGCNLLSTSANLPEYARSSATGSNAAPAKRTFERADHSLLSGLLFLGRLAWLFKIRGTFLENALQPRAANGRTPSVDASSSGANLHSVALAGGNNASFMVRVQGGRHSVAQSSEDQFRSAFEIADTNGDGVLSYLEALEALSALSGEGEPASPVKTPGGGRSSTSNTSNTSSSALGKAFSLSAELTPTLTYTEFALICGSTLLSAEDCRPVSRLGRCLEQLVAGAHVAWALATVHVLGHGLRAQYMRELGLCLPENSGTKSTARSAAPKRAGAVDREAHKPFKINWVDKWIDLDGNVEEDGISAQSAGAQKERVMIPAGLANSLRVLLHKVAQHGAAAVVSIDTMQAAAVTAQSAASRAYSVTGGAAAGGESRGKSAAAAMRDEFSDLLGETQEVSESDGEDNDAASAFFEPAGLLATLAGARGDCEGGPVKVVLSQLALRVLTHVTLAYVGHVSAAVLLAVRPPGSAGAGGTAGALAADAVEDAAIQAVFDLSVLGLLGAQWMLAEWQKNPAVAKARSAANPSGSRTVGLSARAALWKAHLDPITAELVMPLVQASVASHMQAVTLLAPHCQDVATSAGRDAATAPRVLVTPQSSAKSSEQLLAPVFPAASHTAARFTLLPLAVSTAPLPAAASARPASAAANGSNGARHSASSGSLAGENSSSNAGKGSTGPATAGASTSAKAKSGVMNWW